MAMAPTGITLAHFKSGTASDDHFAHGAGECFVNCTNTSRDACFRSLLLIASGEPNYWGSGDTRYLFQFYETRVANNGR